jgi:tetratricopeptide (TPR) repeat protein
LILMKMDLATLCAVFGDPDRARQLFWDEWNQYSYPSRYSTKARRRILDLARRVGIDLHVMVRDKTEDLAETRQLTLELLAKQGNLTSDSDGSLLSNLRTLADVCEKLGRMSEAEDAHRRLIEVARALHSSQPRLLDSALLSAASFFERMDRPDDSAPLFEESIELNVRMGAIAVIAGAQFNRIAESYERRHRYAEAEQVYRRLLALYASQFERDERRLAQENGLIGEPPVSWRSLSIILKLADALVAQEKLDEAERLLRHANAIRWAQSREWRTRMGELAAAQSIPFHPEQVTASNPFDDAYHASLDTRYAQVLRRLGRTEDALTFERNNELASQ